MPVLEWDQVGDRVFESGLDRGVLYLPDGSAVPWNGLTSVIESFNRETSPVYYDGMKINDLITLGDFSATMKAVTYPPEFTPLEGSAPVKTGLYYADQPPQSFGLAYRTKVGNDLDGEDGSYKIHILYNVTAIPSDKTYASHSQNPSLVEFEWKITAVPEEISGFAPTAHLTIDSKDVDPWLLEDLEALLYGTSLTDAALIPMADLVNMINTWFRVKITDNGDGTWTATSQRDGFISINIVTQYFDIVGVNAVYLDDDTFQISDTTDISEVPEIQIDVFDNGSWTATTSHGGLINMIDANTFEILNANVIYQTADEFEITDTVADG
jgi:hypothetical protein